MGKTAWHLRENKSVVNGIMILGDAAKIDGRGRSN